MNEEERFKNDHGILIVGHGSRESKSVEEFERLVSAYRELHPEFEVRVAHVELTPPDVKTALYQFALCRKKIIIVPLFLFTSGHVKNDLPLIINELKVRFLNHHFIVTEAIGVEPKMVEILINRVRSLQTPRLEQWEKTGIIIVGRGSSDIDANGDFHKLVRFFEEANPCAFVFPAYIGITKPLISEVLKLSAKLRPDRLIMIPYFLFYGRLMNRIEKMRLEFSVTYPWIRTELTSYIGPDPSILAIIDDRIKRATHGQMPLPCVTCEYRQHLPGLANKVGGLRALLWSLRHLETHTQAGPHEFPHKNLKKHILVCENVDCASRGSIALVSKMRNLIKKCGMQADFKITRTSCMGRCGEGPTVVVYPDGIWYRNVQEEDAETLVNQHLLNDKLVSKLVDNIMQ